MKEHDKIVGHEMHTEVKKNDDFDHDKESIDRAHEVVDCA